MFYNELITFITKALALFKELKAISNILWVKNIKKNFIPMIEMIKEVEQYKWKRTIPLIQKGHTNNTQFLN